MEFNKHYNFHCGSAKKVLTTKWEEYISTLKSNLSQLYSLDADSIHDVRVTSRRIRALYAELKSFYSFPEELLNISKEITRLLGKRRELDVVRDLSTSIFSENSSFTVHFSRYIDIKREHEVENCIIATKLTEKIISYEDLILDLPQLGKNCFLKFLDERVSILLSRLTKIRKRVKKFSEQFEHTDEELHLIRVKLKKIRYSLEIFGILIDEIIDFLPKLKEVQEILGEWNDNRLLLLYIKEFKDSFQEGLPPDLMSEIEKKQNYLNKLIEQKRSGIRPIIKENFRKRSIEKVWKGLKKTNSISCCFYERITND